MSERVRPTPSATTSLLQRVEEGEELLLLCWSELIEAALDVVGLALVALDGVCQG